MTEAFKEDRFPEPPELKKQGIPPLKKQIRIFLIGLLIAFIIVLAFALIFKLRDG